MEIEDKNTKEKQNKELKENICTKEVDKNLSICGNIEIPNISVNIPNACETLKNTKIKIPSYYNHLMDYQKSFSNLLEPILPVTRELSILSKNAVECLSVIQSEMNEIRPFISDCANFSSVFTDSFKNIVADITPITNELVETMRSLSPIIASKMSPFEKWINLFDKSETWKILVNNEEEFQKYIDLKIICTQVMYDAEWFPYCPYVGDVFLFDSIDEVIKTSQTGLSKRKIGRIDKAILDFYDDKMIREVKKRWNDLDNIDFTTKKIIKQAINAYLRHEYALTISCLAPMWETLIVLQHDGWSEDGKKRRASDIVKDNFREIIKQNEYDVIFYDFYDNFIMHQCNSLEDVKEGIPNRHGVAHGWYKKYPNRKAALNAILLTDFILNLKPIDLHAGYVI